eukprot:6056126-Prymnesium_polylepis.2
MHLAHHHDGRGGPAEARLPWHRRAQRPARNRNLSSRCTARAGVQAGSARRASRTRALRQSNH